MTKRAPRPVRLTWQGPSGQTYSISIDATVSEEHKLTATITDHPIETGANVGDHVRPEPLELTLEGVISNTPIFLPTDHADGAREVSIPIKGPSPTIGSTVGRVVPIAGALVSRIPLPLPGDSGVARGFDPGFDRVQAVYSELWDMRLNGTPMRAITTLREYDNLVIAALSVKRDVSSGKSLVFTLNLHQIEFGATVAATTPSFAKKVSKGTSVAKAAEDAAPVVQQSMLSSLFGSP